MKIRYKDKGSEAELTQIDSDKIKIIFKEKKKSITPGQSAVFYIGEDVLGGGLIKDVIDLTLDRFNGVHLKLDDIAAFMSKYASVNALGFESNGTHYKTSMYRRSI